MNITDPTKILAYGTEIIKMLELVLEHWVSGDMERQAMALNSIFRIMQEHDPLAYQQVYRDGMIQATTPRGR